MKVCCLQQSVQYHKRLNVWIDHEEDTTRPRPLRWCFCSFFFLLNGNLSHFFVPLMFCSVNDSGNQFKTHCFYQPCDMFSSKKQPLQIQGSRTMPSWVVHNSPVGRNRYLGSFGTQTLIPSVYSVRPSCSLVTVVSKFNFIVFLTQYVEMFFFPYSMQVIASKYIASTQRRGFFMLPYCHSNMMVQRWCVRFNACQNFLWYFKLWMIILQEGVWERA